MWLAAMRISGVAFVNPHETENDYGAGVLRLAFGKRKNRRELTFVLLAHNPGRPELCPGLLWDRLRRETGYTDFMVPRLRVATGKWLTRRRAARKT